MRSNLTNSEVTKPISIYIESLRITKNIDDSQKQNNLIDNKSTELTDFRTKNVPSILIKFAQVCN